MRARTKTRAVNTVTQAEVSTVLPCLSPSLSVSFFDFGSHDVQYLSVTMSMSILRNNVKVLGSKRKPFQRHPRPRQILVVALKCTSPHLTSPSGPRTVQNTVPEQSSELHVSTLPKIPCFFLPVLFSLPLLFLAHSLPTYCLPASQPYCTLRISIHPITLGLASP